MASKYWNRKYLAPAFCFIGFGVQFDDLSRHHALLPVPWATLLDGAAAGLLLPGGVVAVLVRDVTGQAFHFSVMVWLSVAFWLFPVARVRRWFGVYDAFAEGPRRRPLLMRGAASILDTLNKRLFGRQKTGGWA